MRVLLEMSITNACTNACSYCIAKGTNRVNYNKYRIAEGNGLYLDPKAICRFCEGFISECKEGVVIALTGGEPMCHPAFRSIVRKLAALTIKHNSRLVVYTNLQLLTQDRLDLINMNVDFVIAGFHPDSDTMGAKPDEFVITDAKWMIDHMNLLTVKKVVNIISGAYKDTDVDAARLAFNEANIPCIITPKNRNLSEKSVDMNWKESPLLLNVRPDGAIIKCNGEPVLQGNIYDTEFKREMLCQNKCCLCPSYWCYMWNEDLFKGENYEYVTTKKEG
jgi:organic radical activating enzyme